MKQILVEYLTFTLFQTSTKTAKKELKRSIEDKNIQLFTLIFQGLRDSTN